MEADKLGKFRFGHFAVFALFARYLRYLRYFVGSFAVTIQTQSDFILEIREGAEFKDWDDVLRSVNKLEVSTGEKYKTHSSHLIKTKDRPDDSKYNTKLKYKNYMFFCKEFPESLARKLVRDKQIKQ